MKIKKFRFLLLMLTVCGCQLVADDAIPTTGTRIAVTVRLRRDNTLVEGSTVSLYKNSSCGSGFVKSVTTKADGKAYFGTLDGRTYYSIKVTQSNLQSDCATQRTENDLENSFSMYLY